ncbi:MAG TPA: DNA topoisomerase IB [Candidatus Dormibacteraeota bacterium]|nr:DNA topoisomerase IB [Candidatus Dormibacteraeota bacterium]
MGRTRAHAAGGRLTQPADGAEAAREVGLTYTSDVEPGLTRSRKGKGFIYTDPHGKLVRESETLERIRTLAIPPAWEHVWITIRPRGHLQATGRDARGRKQHRYHPRWREMRDENKFGRMVGFAKALPRIRRRVARDLRRRGLPREKVIATIVKVLETTFVRIGNEEYAQQNGSFGLTTLRSRHVTVTGATVRFVFKGKSGREVQVGLTNPRVARVVKRCDELPGQQLFQYVDDSGARRNVTSDDVNQYLREASGEDFTAKDFRTWAATVLATCALRELAGFESETEGRRNVVAAVDQVARKLGHTRAICRRSYVHPAVIETYLDGSLELALGGSALSTPAMLRSDEAAALTLLKRAAGREVSRGAARHVDRLRRAA